MEDLITCDFRVQLYGIKFSYQTFVENVQDTKKYRLKK